MVQPEKHLSPGERDSVPQTVVYPIRTTFERDGGQYGADQNNPAYLVSIVLHKIPYVSARIGEVFPPVYVRKSSLINLCYAAVAIVLGGIASSYSGLTSGPWEIAKTYAAYYVILTCHAFGHHFVGLMRGNPATATSLGMLGASAHFGIGEPDWFTLCAGPLTNIVVAGLSAIGIFGLPNPQLVVLAGLGRSAGLASSYSFASCSLAVGLFNLFPGKNVLYAFARILYAFAQCWRAMRDFFRVPWTTMPYILPGETTSQRIDGWAIVLKVINVWKVKIPEMDGDRLIFGTLPIEGYTYCT